jgi:hypothetical protein
VTNRFHTFLGERRDQLEEVALDLAVAGLFALVWYATLDIPRLAQWLPEFVSMGGLIIVALKITGDLFAFAKPPRTVEHGATRL